MSRPCARDAVLTEGPAVSLGGARLCRGHGSRMLHPELCQGTWAPVAWGRLGRKAHRMLSSPAAIRILWEKLPLVPHCTCSHDPTVNSHLSGGGTRCQDFQVIGALHKKLKLCGQK